MIVHLCGMPGVGKLTVARALSARLSGRLLDNHLFVDLACAVVGRSADYMPLLRELTECCYERLRLRNPPEPLVFTNALAAEYPEDVARLEALRGLAQDLARPFVPVLLTCALEENERRLVAESRALKGKLRDVDVLRDIFAASTPAHLPEHPNALVLDTTQLAPEQAADRIAAHCTRCTHVEHG